ncbi:MAG: DUF2027 domain-containing protein [Bacteroidales bacterium]|nr:DUF2027 domain-containing protein [Bacteroidales bacterium]
MNIAISDIDAYLVNDSNYGFLYAIGVLENNMLSSLKKGFIEDNTKVHLGRFIQSDLSKAKKWLLQGIYVGNAAYKVQQPVNEEISLSEYDFYRARNFSVNDYFNEKALVIKIISFDIAEAIAKLKDHGFNKAKKRPRWWMNLPRQPS